MFLRQVFCLKNHASRQENCLRDKKLVSETSFLYHETKKLVSETFFVSETIFCLRDKFLVSGHLSILSCSRDDFLKNCLTTFSSDTFMHAHPGHRGPCTGPLYFQLYLPPSLLCMRYLNRKRLDKATPQAVFLPPLLTEAAASHAPQLSSL